MKREYVEKLLARREKNTVEKATESAPKAAASVLLNTMKEQGAHDGDARLIPLDEIAVSRQHREHFDQESIRELAMQIKQDGLYNPILVRPVEREDAKYELVQGERRFRAYQLLRREEGGEKWGTIRATVRKMSDYDKTVAQLAENIQREDMRPIEEAEALRDVMETHERVNGSKLTVRALAELVSKSPSWVSKRLALLEKPEEVKQALREGALTVDQAAHSKTQSAEPKPARRKASAPPVARVSATVLEETVKRMNKLCEALGVSPIELPSKPARKDYVAAFELRITEILDAAHRRIKQ